MFRSRLPALAGLALVVIAACVIVARQPVTSPWWIYADADSTYTSSALEIAGGYHTNYLDHPGLPEQELMAAAFDGLALAHGGSTRTWTQNEMLHLDRTRPVFRGLAIGFFVGGAILSFFLLAAALGHWTWGVAGGLLWLAQPELPDVLQIRPDVLLAGLALVAGFLLSRAAERRSVALLALAAWTVGFAIMVKLAAVALLAPLLLVAVARYPGPGSAVALRSYAREWLSRHRLAASLAVAAWVAVALFFNLRAPVAHPSKSQLAVVVAAVAGWLFYWAACRIARLRGNRLAQRVFDPLFLALAVAFALGVLATVGLLVGDGLRAISSVLQTLAGRNVNAGITPFSERRSEFVSYPLLVPLVVFVLGALGAARGLLKRDLWPLVWFLGAAVAAAMAAARLGQARYFALPYVLSIPPALWFLRRSGRSAAPLLVWPLVALLLVPTFRHSADQARDARRQEAEAAAASRLADRLLGAGQVAIVHDQFPAPDDRWYTLVDIYTDVHPFYPYRLIDDVPSELRLVAARHQKLAYYIGTGTGSGSSLVRLHLMSGDYTGRPVPGSIDPATRIGAVKLVSGPGT